jgi:hypothetical protein
LFAANKLIGLHIDMTVSKGLAPAEITQEYLCKLGGKPQVIKLGSLCLYVKARVDSLQIETDDKDKFRVFLPNCNGEWEEISSVQKSELTIQKSEQ